MFYGFIFNSRFLLPYFLNINFNNGSPSQYAIWFLERPQTMDEGEERSWPGILTQKLAVEICY